MSETRINYIEQINSFWAYSESADLSPIDIAVYFSLLKYNNSLGWIEQFYCDYSIICQYSKTSKNSFYKSVDTLKNHRLIDYKKGERNVLKPRISILNLGNRKGTIKEQHEEQKGNTEGTEREQNEEQKGNLYKQETIKLKTNKQETINNVPDGLHKKFISVYDEWFKNRNGVSTVKYSAVDFKGFKDLREYILKISKENEDQAVLSWQYILNNWQKLDKYYQSKITPHQISSNISNIIDQLKNGSGSTNKNDAAIDALRILHAKQSKQV